MLVSKKHIKGDQITDTKEYRLYDNRYLKNLVLSKTVLNPEKATRGHKHDNLDEIYFFEEGEGCIQLDQEFIDVEPGSVVLIPGGVFHRVHNPTNSRLVFISVFQTYTRTI